MKNLVFAFMCSLFAATPSDAQNVKPQTYSYVEQMPEPNFNISEFLTSNLQYPKEALDANTEGRVIVKFVVDKKGKVNDAKIIRSVSPALDKEALRVVSLFPSFKPGSQNGKKVSVYYTLPINFQLEKEGK